MAPIDLSVIRGEPGRNSSGGYYGENRYLRHPQVVECQVFSHAYSADIGPQGFTGFFNSAWEIKCAP